MHAEIDRFAHLDSWLHRLDPRWKLSAAMILVVAIALDRPSVRTQPDAARDLTAAVACLVLALGLVVSSKIPLGFALQRILPATGFLALMLVFLPLAYRDETVQLGWLEISLTGLLVAGVILIKALAILIIVFPALGTTRFDRTMKALHRLRVPPAIVEIALFAYRYLFVFFDQHRRIRQALRARGFRSRSNLWSLRIISRSLGTLLVSSLQRTRRIQAAMWARGYTGDYPSLAEFRTAAPDVATFTGALVISTVLLLWRFA